MPFFRGKKDKEKEQKEAAAAAAAGDVPGSPVIQRKATGKKVKRHGRGSNADRSVSVSTGDIPEAVNNSGKSVGGSSGNATPSPEPSDASLTSPSTGEGSAASSAGLVAGPSFVKRDSHHGLGGDARKSSAPSFSGSTASGHMRMTTLGAADLRSARPHRSQTMASDKSRMSTSSEKPMLPPREPVKRVPKTPRDEFLALFGGQEKQLSGLDLQLGLPVVDGTAAEGVRRTVTIIRDESKNSFRVKSFNLFILGTKCRMYSLQSSHQTCVVFSTLLSSTRYIYFLVCSLV